MNLLYALVCFALAVPLFGGGLPGGVLAAVLLCYGLSRLFQSFEIDALWPWNWGKDYHQRLRESNTKGGALFRQLEAIERTADEAIASNARRREEQEERKRSRGFAKYAHEQRQVLDPDYPLDA
jgi:hypothetical protein